MTVEVYVGDRADHTHENIDFRVFVERLNQRLGQSRDWMTVIGHALWGNAAIDAVCITQTAITVIDFKSFGGRIRVYENGPWQADDGIVRGGAKENPFAQIRDNKFVVKSWLQDKRLLADCNFGHISGAIIFSGPITVEGDLGPKIKSWFHITDLVDCAELLSALASPQLRVTNHDVDEIVRLLGVREYSQSGDTVTVRPVETRDGDRRQAPELSEEQWEALNLINTFLTTAEAKVFRLLGMTCSGKTTLLIEAVKQVQRLGRQPILLAPNARVARSLAREQDFEAEGLYGHLYDRSSPRNQRVAGQDEQAARKVIVFPLTHSEDPEDCVYIIDEAQLIGNCYYEMAGERWGSGQIFDDFLKFSDLLNNARQVILAGDHFQLPRGGVENMPLFEPLLNSRALPSMSFTTEQIFQMGQGSAQMANAQRLAEAIAAKRFSSLDLKEDENCLFIHEEQKADTVKRLFSEKMAHAWFITATNASAQAFNNWIRKELWKVPATPPLVEGEMLECYVVDRVATSSVEDTELTARVGDRIYVAILEAPVRQEQPLKGQQPVSFQTQAVMLRGVGAETNALVSLDFLRSESAKLPTELQVAMKVWQERHQESPVWYARYAYAATAHHAQGGLQPICVIDAQTREGRHTENYFRWLYTAITRAERQVLVINYNSITPLDEARWSNGGAQYGGPIPAGPAFNFDKDAPISEADKRRAVPQRRGGEGFSVAQANLWLAVSRCLEPHGWCVTDIVSHTYQEIYEFRHQDGRSAALRFSYNQDWTITAIASHHGLQGDALKPLLQAGSRSKEPDDPIAIPIFDDLQQCAEAAGLKVGLLRNPRFALHLTFRADDGVVHLHVHYDARGVVSTVQLRKASSEAFAGRVRTCLKLPE